jgi:vacuolar-type H+-ATPase subunit H
VPQPPQPPQVQNPMQNTGIPVAPPLEQHKTKAQREREEVLAAEQQTINNASQWHDNATKALFTNDDSAGVLNDYENFKNNRDNSRDPMLGATLGILANAAQQPDGANKAKAVMDALLNGRPLDASFAQIIKDGVQSANEILTNEDPTKLQQMLSNGIREFSKRAGEEPELSLRSLQLGEMINSALTMAQKENLNLDLNEN